MTQSQKYPMELFDETLDINATENYDLSLELSEDGLSLAVLDLLRGNMSFSGTTRSIFTETTRHDRMPKSSDRMIS